ncbi:MAG TPA: hypothetical protein VK698_18405 [Kofleriaceae bacterium]|nr:hypothetical protein [Kofleriaceae bacterium]
MNTTNNSRLDGLLDRNRKSRVVDLALAAIFPIALFLSGMTLANELPKLGSAPKAAVPAATATASAAAHDLAPV